MVRRHRLSSPHGPRSYGMDFGGEPARATWVYSRRTPSLHMNAFQLHLSASDVELGMQQPDIFWCSGILLVARDPDRAPGRAT
eukprot:scaffold16099_cov117-Isochrysis_galbana.AAC.6